MSGRIFAMQPRFQQQRDITEGWMGPYLSDKFLAPFWKQEQGSYTIAWGPQPWLVINEVSIWCCFSPVGIEHFEVELWPLWVCTLLTVDAIWVLNLESLIHYLISASLHLLVIHMRSHCEHGFTEPHDGLGPRTRNLPSTAFKVINIIPKYYAKRKTTECWFDILYCINVLSAVLNIS